MYKCDISWQSIKICRLVYITIVCYCVQMCMCVPLFGYQFKNVILSLPLPPPLSQILTTHTMEEADHYIVLVYIRGLETLVIFAVWGLRIGSSLNSVLDTSWRLTVLQGVSLICGALQFVRNNLRKAVHIETYAGKCRV